MALLEPAAAASTRCSSLIIYSLLLIICLSSTALAARPARPVPTTTTSTALPIIEPAQTSLASAVGTTAQTSLASAVGTADSTIIKPAAQTSLASASGAAETIINPAVAAVATAAGTTLSSNNCPSNAETPSWAGNSLANANQNEVVKSLASKVTSKARVCEKEALKGTASIPIIKSASYRFIETIMGQDNRNVTQFKMKISYKFIPSPEEFEKKIERFRSFDAVANFCSGKAGDPFYDPKKAPTETERRARFLVEVIYFKKAK